ncbi:MAG TPA: hypothetical protein VJL90_15255 [Pseudorhodoplanes sp.]|nr:hypothetical protein [Pseudorhodoplanes sp.]
MNETTKKAAAALELLPEDMREPAVAYLIEQAEKYRSLKALVDEGIDDVEARRVAKWDFEDFLRRAKRTAAK